MNYDTAEVNKFSALTSTWWDKNGPCAPLHALNPARLQFILQHTSVNHKKILDVGCGAGILTESLALHHAQVLGIDASDSLIAEARRHAFDMGITVDYQHATAEQLLASHTGQFDVITCMELLEHVPDPAKLIADCAQLLKPGGKLFLSTLNRTPRAYLLAIIGAEYLCNILPKHTHDYKKFIQPAELANMLQQAKLKLLNLNGLEYRPFTKTSRITTDVRVNYLAFATKEI
jgi:2-polyprenyl-6-hydroxyphenyl methylase / 3-demethylubiquinone-9 3-methyltransferase